MSLTICFLLNPSLLKDRTSSLPYGRHLVPGKAGSPAGKRGSGWRGRWGQSELPLIRENNNKIMSWDKQCWCKTVHFLRAGVFLFTMLFLEHEVSSRFFSKPSCWMIHLCSYKETLASLKRRKSNPQYLLNASLLKGKPWYSTHLQTGNCPHSLPPQQLLEQVYNGKLLNSVQGKWAANSDT